MLTSTKVISAESAIKKIQPYKILVGREQCIREKTVYSSVEQSNDYESDDDDPWQPRRSMLEKFLSKDDYSYSRPKQHQHHTEIHREYYSEDLYIYNGTDVLADLLRANLDVTTKIILESDAGIDYAISGLLELKSLLHRDGVTLNWNKSQIENALKVVVDALSNISYTPTYMASDFSLQIMLLINEEKLKKINTLDELLDFTERNKKIIHLFKDYERVLIKTLRNYVLNDSIIFTESNKNKLHLLKGFESIVNSALDWYMHFDCQNINAFQKSFSLYTHSASHLLNNMFYFRDEKHVDYIKYLFTQGAVLELNHKIFDCMPLPQMQKKCEHYFQMIDMLLQNIEDTKTISNITKFRDDLILLQHKRLFIEMLIENIRDKYKTKPYKVYLGGKPTKALHDILKPDVIDRIRIYLGDPRNDIFVPDGIARIFEVYKNIGLSTLEKYDLIKNIFMEKVKNISTSPKFWRINRDPEIIKFYKDIHTNIGLYESGRLQLLQFENVSVDSQLVYKR